jgi:chromosome segregation ATPase
MSDPNKFINTYIDTTIATLHEFMGSSLQLKTQLKLANDLLLERDATITQLTSEKDTALGKLINEKDEKDAELARLTGELENINNNFSATQDNTETMKAALLSCQDKLKIAEESHSAITSKVSHMDTLLKQLTDMKNEIKTRDDQISSLNADLVAKDNQLLSCNENINNLNLSLIDKDKIILEITKKLEKLTPPPLVPKTEVAKNVKESSTVKVQLNTKTKTKDPDDDF